jgi:hypothetical protein
LPEEGVVGDVELGGMEGVTGEEEGMPEGGGPAGLDEGEVVVFGGAVDFVAYYGVAGVGEVDADLMHAAGLGEGADEGERAVTTGEAAEDLETGAGGGAGGVDALFQVNAGDLVDALAEEGGVDGEVVRGGPAPDEGEVLFLDAGALHEHAEVAGGGLGFGDEGEAAGFAIEAVDDGDLAAVGELEGEEVTEEMPEGGGVGGFAGVNLEEGGLVDDDPVGGLGDDVEAGWDGRGNLNGRTQNA